MPKKQAKGRQAASDMGKTTASDQARVSLRVAQKPPTKSRPTSKAYRGETSSNPRKLAAPSAREGSKTETILGMLKRPNGATINELVKATGWQPHSLRGFLSGTLRKKMRLTIRSTKTEKSDRRYTVAR